MVIIPIKGLFQLFHLLRVYRINYIQGEKVQICIVSIVALYSTFQFYDKSLYRYTFKLHFCWHLWQKCKFTRTLQSSQAQPTQENIPKSWVCLPNFEIFTFSTHIFSTIFNHSCPWKNKIKILCFLNSFPNTWEQT